MATLSMSSLNMEEEPSDRSGNTTVAKNERVFITTTELQNAEKGMYCVATALAHESMNS